MDDATYQLRALLLRDTPPQFVASVDSVQVDGTLNLKWAGTTIPGVPCSSGYPVELRREGDSVVVLTLGEGWVVIGTTGSSRTLPSVDLSDYATKEEVGDLDIPRETVLSWSTGAPTGSGWVAVDQVYLRTTASAVYIHGVRPTSAPAPTPKPDPPAKTPSPVSTGVTSYGAWRDGRRDSGSAPRQSKYNSSFGPYTGAWFYDNLRGHTSGKSVRSMTISLGRSKTSNGISGGARVRLYLTGASRPGSGPPSRYSSVWSPGTLARGQRKTFTIPSVWQDHLASGQAKGIVCYSTARSESIVFSSTADIRITFN